MKQITILLLLFCSIQVFSQTTISLTAKDLPLEKVLLQLETEHNFLFSYAEKDIEDIKISIQTKDELVQPFFQKLLKNTSLQFEIVNDNYVLLTRKNDVSKPTEQLTQICGKILDKLTQAPLPYANVYFQKSQQGMYAKANGNFQLKTDLKTQDSLIVSYVGYQEQRFLAKDFIKNPCLNVELEYSILPDEIIVVKDYLTDGIDLKKNGLSTQISPNRLGSLPGQAEPDVMKTIQFLPGVSSPGETSSDIYIRGGTPDQNLILWEDIPIYHSAHYFGLISAFNPYIMDKVDVYRSGFGAQYGGRASGVIDLQTVEYKKPKPLLGAGINSTTAYLFGKLSMARNKASATFSVRRSITDVWETQTYNKLTNRVLQGISFGKFNDINNLPPDAEFKHSFAFLDANLKLTADLGKKTKAAVSLFYNTNQLNNFFLDTKSTLVQRDSFDLKHQGFSAAIEQEWSNHFSSKITVISSDYDYDYFHIEIRMLPNPRNEFVAKMSKINEQQLILSNQHQLAGNHRLKWGYQYTNYDVKSGFEERRGNRPPIGEGLNTAGKLQVLFSEISTDKNKRFGVDAGLRYSYYSRLKKSYFEPRLHLKYTLSPSLDLHANAGQYHQFLNRLIELKINRPTLIDNPIWVLANDKQTPVVTAFQYQVGAIFHKNGWIVDVQSYYKKLTGITSSSLGFELLPQEGFDAGESRIKGLDLLVKKRWKNYRSWLSYSLSKVDYFFDNYAATSFPAAYDQRHSVSWANLFSYKNWDFSLGFSMTSGTPYTVITDYQLQPNPMPGPDFVEVEYDEINSQNLPLNHHLDASVSYRFLPKNTNRWEGNIGVSISNIYNQQNVYTREYAVDTNGENPKIQFFDYKTLGITPNLVLRFEWH
ncbi:MAG: hypothetical protein ACJAVF_004557 [Paraglaciecola sp.]|jgi:hypothetical protein